MPNKKSQRVPNRSDAVTRANSERVPELAPSAPVAGHVQEPAMGMRPVKEGNIVVTFSTPKQAIAVEFYNTAEGIKWNIGEWDGNPCSEVYSRELQVVTPDIRRHLLHGHLIAKPRAVLEAYESLHEPPPSLQPVHMRIDGQDNKVNLSIIEGKSGYRVYSGGPFERLRRVALHRAAARAKGKGRRKRDLPPKI